MDIINAIFWGIVTILALQGIMLIIALTIIFGGVYLILRLLVKNKDLRLFILFVLIAIATWFTPIPGDELLFSALSIWQGVKLLK